jgi:hypothetical protein
MFAGENKKNKLFFLVWCGLGAVYILALIKLKNASKSSDEYFYMHFTYNPHLHL